MAGVALAIFMQRAELELQRHELQLTREELKRTAEAQERAERSLAEQTRNQVLAARLQALTALLAYTAQNFGKNPYADIVKHATGTTPEAYVKELQDLLQKLRAQ